MDRRRRFGWSRSTSRPRAPVKSWSRCGRSRSMRPTGMSCAASPSSRGPPWGCCGRNTRSSASTLPGRSKRSVAASPGSRPATRSMPTFWTMATAAVPMAAVTALQGLGRHGPIQPGRQVLINGGSGGVGSFAVQLAKSSGAEVTAVASTPNLELVRSLGADHVVDYTTTDAVGGGRRYDRILDTVGNRSVADLRRALAEGGKAAVTGFTSVAKLLGVSLRGGKDVAMVQAHVTAKDLELLSELLTAGKVRPQIDRRYRFAELPEAIAYLEQGRAKGKVVVEVA